MASKQGGYTDEAVGKVKEIGGKVSGNQRLEAEGKAQGYKGEAEVNTAKAEERTKAQGEKLKGNIKEIGGKVLGNQQMEAEGKGNRLKGEAREAANQ